MPFLPAGIRKPAAADCVTLSRIVLSLALFFFPPRSLPFGVLYLMCGISDALDGTVARKTHTASEIGARLDSIADLVFFSACAAKLLPLLTLPLWLWIWTACIAAVKAGCILASYIRFRRFTVPHSAANKVTGCLLFFLPLTAYAGCVRSGASAVCAAASFAAACDVQSAYKGRAV